MAWLTMRVVATSPGFSDSGESIWSEVALVCTVALLASVGIVHRIARPANPLGWLLILVASLLLATEWDIPGAAAAESLSAVMFSVGLLLTIAVPVAAMWAVLAFQSGRVDGRGERYLLLAGALVFVGALGLAPALFFDPQAHGCSDCPANLLLVRDDPAVAAASSRLAMIAALAWTVVMMVVLLVGLVRMSAVSRRAHGAVATIGFLYLLAVSAQLVLEFDHGFVGGSTTDPALWWAQLAGLAALGAAVAFSLLRSRAMRRSVAGLVVDLHQEAVAGGMREALAAWLHDPSLQVAYPVDGTYRDVDLDAVDVTARPGRTTSRLVNDGDEIAVLVHRTGLLDNPDAVREVVTAARLGLENERLRAEGLAQVRALAESRVRVIEAGDRERRRLERDLHDGAQQRLVGLLLGLRLLRSSTRSDQPELDRMLNEAETEVQDAVRDLRQLANGLFPNVLVTEGLAGACGALSETAPLRMVAAPEGRLPAEVETTAYLVIATCAARGPTTVRATVEGSRLKVCAKVARARVGVAALEDRVAAMGGRIAVTQEVDGGSRVDLELPLARGASPDAEPPDRARK
ncbi:histidine kinase [Humibacillus xanthopallidus]|nr:histidine kinase [Humibacillus xanthopallidus]